MTTIRSIDMSIKFCILFNLMLDLLMPSRWVFSCLHIYQILWIFPTYTVIRNGTFIKSEIIFLPTRLFGHQDYAAQQSNQILIPEFHAFFQRIICSSLSRMSQQAVDFIGHKLREIIKVVWHFSCNILKKECALFAVLVNKI